MPKTPPKAADTPVSAPPVDFAALFGYACFAAGYGLTTVAPGSPFLPPGLHLTEVAPAAALPDGRLLPLTLPPDLYPVLYPDLYEVA